MQYLAIAEVGQSENGKQGVVELFTIASTGAVWSHRSLADSVPGTRLRGTASSLFRSVVVAGVSGMLLCSCADISMPPYEQPATPSKNTWSRSASVVSASETISPEWWREFRDPYLDDLVKRAIAQNFDLKVLAARIGVADALIGEVKAGALPTVDLGAGADIGKTSSRALTRQYNVGTQLNWEIDIWGKVEKGVQAQKAEFRATEADWRAGYLTLVSNVAATYFKIRQLDQQIEQQQKALATNKQIFGIYKAQYDNGIAPKTQVMRQQAEINGLTNDLLELRRSRDIADNALSTLIGVPAGEFKVPPGRLEANVHVPVVPAGLPSQLLARRPDVIAAEYRVLEGYDLTGQAKLAQLPSIGLTARGGSASFALGDLLKSFTFGFLPSINLPMFDPGVKARIKTSEAQIEVAKQQYRQTVMAAFEEVENALVNLDAHKQQKKELQQQTDQLKQVAAQVHAQLKEGVVSQLEVFETERSLLAAQLALLSNYQQILADTVTLYKAMGGGWPPVVVGAAND